MNGKPHDADDACNKLYGEEDWIDWLLGHKPQAERDAMASHLARCARCRDIRETWTPLLEGAGSTEVPAMERAGGPAIAGAGHAWAGTAAIVADAAAGEGRGASRREQPMPSDARRERLRRYVRARSAGLRLRRLLPAHRRMVAAAVAAALLVLLAAGVYRTAPSQSERRMVDAAVLEPTAAAFLQDPRTASFKIHPEAEELGEGYIWFNETSGEVYVMLEGLLPSAAHDVQVWAVNQDEHVNLGLLHHDRPSRAHLYVKQEMLLQAHRIALTVEPAGGSSNPTEPDALVFRLRRG
ncbi:anti-sigma factor [Paenibacillus glycinis]|uniref:Anti-sigma K factor RskA C-terminal domain-containing protein n=1 Tax=Paenibacillus glycinis TaxID=2697035 RepID=A0ABW9XT49_9BACL|nr:anti-sigma factor [Paenibacillus glycinis]NBD25837.1 hypothetical protein [Paenibacillus glycinis]